MPSPSAWASDGKFDLLSNTGGHFIVDLTGYYAPPAAGGLFFHPLSAPVRLLDTRGGQSAFVHPNAPLTAGQTLNLPGQFTSAASPSRERAGAGGQRDGGQQRQCAGRLRDALPRRHEPAADEHPQLRPRHRRAERLHRGLGGDGSFNLFSNTGGNFIVDVSGYYDTNGAGGLLFYPLTQPTRELDTRPGQSAATLPAGR